MTTLSLELGLDQPVAPVDDSSDELPVLFLVEPEHLHEYFPEWFDRFREAAGLTCRGLAHLLRVNVRSVRRWRAGTKLGSGHLISLFNLAAGMGLLHILLPSVGEMKCVDTR